MAGCDAANGEASDGHVDGAKHAQVEAGCGDDDVGLGEMPGHLGEHKDLMRLIGKLGP